LKKGGGDRGKFREEVEKTSPKKGRGVDGRDWLCNRENFNCSANSQGEIKKGRGNG